MSTDFRSYSSWHRPKSASRFVGFEGARIMTAIDLDTSLFVEYDDGTKEPLALVQAALDRGQETKPATVAKALAQRCRLPAFVVLYRLANRPNPASPEWRDIEEFRVKRVWPDPEGPWERLTPAQWAQRLATIHNH